MADNVQLPPVTGSGGDVTAADEIGGVKFQRVKLIHGADGVNDGDVSSANPLPITGTQDDGAVSNGKAMVVAGITPGGNVQILETNGSGHLHIADGGGSITVDGTFWQATQPVSAASLPLPTGAATDATLVAIQALSQQIENMVDSINTLVQFLYANSPRIDALNRMAVNNSEVTQPVSGTVTATVASTVVSNMTTISGQPVQYFGQNVPLHIYDNIKVT